MKKTLAKAFFAVTIASAAAGANAADLTYQEPAPPPRG
jgi:hypothetical protein